MTGHAMNIFSQTLGSVSSVRLNAAYERGEGESRDDACGP
jgi:hypothetical protein